MNSLYIATAALVLYIAAYHSYGKFLARKLFNINPDSIAPSHEHNDGVDYVPTHKRVLFGHHFASIAGTGPIVGPAIAIIWGWLPALLWVIFGSILMGAVHDFGSLVVSMRKNGRSIGDIAGELINPRVKLLFLLIIFFLVLIVIAIFGMVIAAVFKIFPCSVFPIWSQIPIAVTLGYLIYYRNVKLWVLPLAAVIIMYACIFVGAAWPITMPATVPLGPVGMWVVILLIYAYIASILPVQILLQPRDYINACQLIVAMLLLFAGLIVSHPDMAAPPLRHVADAPPMFPMLFVIIACGAISGFHSLVSSGTSSKQCDSERDTLFVGYGSMLTEGMLAVLVIIACGAGMALGLKLPSGDILTGSAAFEHKYATWSGVNGLAPQLDAFIQGSTNMIAATGFPAKFAATIMGVFVAAFAATTLDSATRIQRYIVSELANSAKLPWLGHKHPATAIAVVSAFLLAFHDGKGAGALVLWPLFGCLNQLLAALALFVISLYLAHHGKRLAFTLIPMLFMFAVTAWAMYGNLVTFIGQRNILLSSISIIIAVFELWMIVEGSITLIKMYSRKQNTAITLGNAE